MTGVSFANTDDQSLEDQQPYEEHLPEIDQYDGTEVINHLLVIEAELRNGQLSRAWDAV